MIMSDMTLHYFINCNTYRNVVKTANGDGAVEGKLFRRPYFDIMEYEWMVFGLSFFALAQLGFKGCISPSKATTDSGL